MKKILLGVAPTRRFCFSAEDARKYKSLVEAKLREWGIEFVNIDSVTEEGLLIHQEHSDKAARFFIEKGVDAVFCPHVNFGTEEVVCRMAASVGKPVLLWGPRDEAPLPDGRHLRDTQCGLFATSNVLQKYGVPFTYIVNSRVESGVFKRGVLNFVAAMQVVKNFLGARIGQIGTRPPNFYTVIVNEQELLRRWGIETAPISLLDLLSRVKTVETDAARVDAAADDIAKRIATGPVTREKLRGIAALKLAMLDWARQDNLSAIAIRCHEDLPETMQLYSCFANGEVTGEGVPVACETDLHGALSSILLQSASLAGKTTFFADLTQRHPTNNNAELLWHCGNFPQKLCRDPSRATLGCHCNIEPGLPGTGTFEIAGGDVTVCRFDGIGDKYSLLFGTGKGCEGPLNQGTYLWFEVDNWPEWEERIIYGPYVHHVAGINESVAPVLYTALRFLPGITPDPTHPTEAEIRAYLRGDDLDE